MVQYINNSSGLVGKTEADLENEKARKKETGEKKVKRRRERRRGRESASILQDCYPKFKSLYVKITAHICFQVSGVYSIFPLFFWRYRTPTHYIGDARRYITCGLQRGDVERSRLR